jgi:hypothetical protein
MALRALLAVTAAVTLVVAPTAAQAAKRKPVSGSYPVFIPVPYPNESASGSHCEDAPDLSRDLRTFAFPGAGKLKVALSGTVGDHVIELFDHRGRLVATAGAGPGVDVTNTLTYKKKSRGSEKLTVGICNFAGGPEGHVTWSFTFD